MPRQKSLFRMIFEPIAIAIGLAAAARAVVHIYSIPSESMVPTLEVGDQIVVTRYFGGGAPERGQVIVFQSPQQPDELLVKRVVGIPGDLVDSRLGRVRIGGHTFPEPYLLRQAATGAIAPQIVPADCYFVLGDNRDDSVDSRSWGIVPRSLVVGRAQLVLWSSAPLGQVAQAAPSTGTHFRHASSRGRLFKWIE